MMFVRILLVVLIASYATLSGAMGAGHASGSHSEHAAMDATMADVPTCCEDSTDRTPNCHVLTALCPSALKHSPSQVSGEDLFVSYGLMLTGINPSGLLDPPRTV